MNKCKIYVPLCSVKTEGVSCILQLIVLIVGVKMFDMNGEMQITFELSMLVL